MDRIGKITVVCGIAALLAVMCVPVSAMAKIPVMVSIVPQKYFAQKVGKNLASVQVMVPPGASPHDYEPKPSQMAALARSKVYFAIGVEFEKAWLPRFLSANSKLVVVHTDAKVPKAPMAGRHEHDRNANRHKAGERRHDHEGLDPHIWLSPRLAAIQARAMRDALVKLDPGHAAEYDRNLAGFEKELQALDQKLRQAFTGLGKKRDILVFHPAWGYLCRDYGLRQVAVEKEGKEPTAKGLARLIEQAKKSGAKVIFVQPQFSTKSAATVAKAIGGRVVPINPLAADWSENLLGIARELKKAAY